MKVQKSLSECEPNPCLNGGRCEVLPTGSGYRCTHCLGYADWKNCENVKCDQSKKYFLRNDTTYVVFETSSTWEEAKRKCASEGMSLAMPKDKDSTEFIVNELRPIYGMDAVKQYEYFWFGLKYIESKKHGPTEVHSGITPEEWQTLKAILSDHVAFCNWKID